MNPQINFIAASTTGTNTKWLLDKLDSCLPIPGVLATGNGTNFYSKLPSGTVLGKKTSDGKFHPVGRASITATVSSSNNITVGAAAAKHFLVGDVVDVVDDENANIVTGRTITNINPTTGVITISGAAVSAAIGDQIRRADGTQTAYGLLHLLDESPSIGLVNSSDTIIRVEKGITVLLRGCIIQAQHPNINAYDIADLKALGCGYRFI